MLKLGSDDVTWLEGCIGTYVGGSISFRPDIQRPRQMQNAKCSEGYIEPSIVGLLYQFQVATCSSMLEALVLVGRVVVSC